MFILMFVFDLLGMVIHATCGMIIWNWFMPDIFKLPQLNLVYACGIALVCAVFIGGKKHKLEDMEEDGLKDMIFSKIMNEFLNPIALVVMAWIVHLFV